ncbi:MAG TPA: DUF4038 domain-containing protein [Polyangiaceae bacterium]|nr:DUF4038 domain-containing protein [Polyangiaceae bacterium]
MTSTFSACVLLASFGCDGGRIGSNAVENPDSSSAGGAPGIASGAPSGDGTKARLTRPSGGGSQSFPDASILGDGGTSALSTGGKSSTSSAAGRGGSASGGAASGNGGAASGSGGTTGSAGKGSGGTPSAGSTGLGGAPVNNWTFPLVTSSNSRYLQDSAGKPFPMLFDAGWGALTQITQANFQKYIQDRISKGFDGFEMMAVGHHPRFAHPPYDFANNLPFTKRLDGSAWSGSLSYANAGTDAPDFTTPNETYWTAVDQKMAYLKTSQMVAVLFPAYNGYQGGQEGWMVEMVANGPDKMQAYGAWIANRYKSYPNIVWMLGGDLGTPPNAYTSDQQAVEEAFTNGLKSVATVSTQYSDEWAGSSSGSDIKSISNILFNALTLNAAYSWNPQTRGMYNQCRNSYGFNTPTRPAFVQESLYELNSSPGGGSAPWRQYSWLSDLNTIGGYTFGNESLWPFVDGTWQGQLNSSGSTSAALLNSFIRSIQWWTLVPSGLGGMKVLVTSNAGSSDDNTVSSAAAADGSLLVAYVGPAHTGSFDVAMSALKGPARARWLDPGSGAFTQIATGLANSGTHTFTTPGKDSGGYGDWVLVIDTP